jgi:hypothetical protein
MIQETKQLTQHVQGTSPAKISHTQSILDPPRASPGSSAVTDPSSLERSEQQNPPQCTPMPDLLAGRYIDDISQRDEAETPSPPQDDNADLPVEDTSFADQRALLFARLGIRSEKTDAVPEDIDMLIASLSHIEEKKRIIAAHTIADLYEHLPPKKQMHVRINLILMTWRDASASARIAAIKALARTKEPDVSEALQVALRDEEQDVRAAAARALGKISERMPVAALISTATREQEHWSVRAAALLAMGDSGEHVFLNTITCALEDEDDSVRIAAIHALAQVQGMEGAARLALIAQRDRQPHVKHAALLELEDLTTDADERHRE